METVKIVALVETTAAKNPLQRKQGQSLYIETDKHKILFDLGPDDTFLKNANILGIDLKKVDTVILSHGHSDHGGGLKAFLAWNHTANIYVRPDAFLPHYSRMLRFPVFCGLDTTCKESSQLIFTGQRTIIDKQLYLLSNVSGRRCLPNCNAFLYEQRGRRRVQDTFTHEQSLIVKEHGKIILFCGCAHTGIINIINEVSFALGKIPDVVVSEFHLINPVTKKAETTAFLDKLAYNLKKYSCRYYVCHGGREAVYQYLADQIGDSMQELVAGEMIEIV